MDEECSGVKSKCSNATMKKIEKSIIGKLVINLEDYWLKKRKSEAVCSN